MEIDVQVRTVMGSDNSAHRTQLRFLVDVDRDADVHTRRAQVHSYGRRDVVRSPLRGHDPVASPIVVRV